MKNEGTLPSEVTDIVEMVRNGPVNQPALEQERNFDAGFTPSAHVWKNVREEWITIDGVRKLYTCYSWATQESSKSNLQLRGLWVFMGG
jgi:hypothetical protein